MRQTNDVLLAIIEALPPELREKSLPQILNDHAKRDPSYWLRPATSAEIAALLGMSPAALAQWRWRADNGKGPPAPPGWRKVEGGGWRYSSRLEVLLWAREQMGLDLEAAA